MSVSSPTERPAVPRPSDALSREQCEAILVDMLRARRWSTRLFNLQRQGRAGTVAPVDGEEAAIVAPAHAMDPSVDWVFPQYREPVALSRFGDEVLEKVCLYERGHPEGSHYSPDVHVFPTQISIAAHLPHAAGFAWGERLQGRATVVLTYFGDGASSEGDAHEAMNLAGVLKLPVVFLCVDNGWAISTPREHQTAAVSIASRATGVGMPGIDVDGNDVFAVYDAVADARSLARAGGGPSLVVAKTFRLGPHTTADDPTRYVPAGELEHWRHRDPIDRFEHLLIERGWWAEGRRRAVDDEADAVFDEVWARAEAMEAQPGAYFDYVFAEPTPQLERQRADLLDYLASKGK